MNPKDATPAKRPSSRKDGSSGAKPKGSVPSMEGPKPLPSSSGAPRPDIVKTVGGESNPLMSGMIIAAFLVAAILCLPSNSFRVIPEYTLLEPWRHEDLTAAYTFAIRKTSAELEQERRILAEQNIPVFHVDPDAVFEMESRIASGTGQLDAVLDAHRRWRAARSETPGAAAGDSLQFVSLRQNSLSSLPDAAWAGILRWAERRDSVDGAAARLTGTLDQQVLTSVREIAAQGVLDMSKSALSTSQVIVRDTRERTQRTVGRANTLDPDEAALAAGALVSERLDPDLGEAGRWLAERALTPTWRFDRDDTAQELRAALATLSETKGAIAQGQVIIRRGDIVTREKSVILESYAEARAERTTTTERALRFLGDIVILLMVITAFLVYLYLIYPSDFHKPRWIGQILLTVALMLVLNRLVYGVEGLSPYLIPVAIAPILLTIIYSSRVGVLTTMLLAILSGMIQDGSFEFATATFIAGNIGLLASRDLTDRNRFFITAPTFILLGYALIIGGFTLSHGSGWNGLLGDLGSVLINSILILLAYPLIILYEKVFGNLTLFTLHELADTHHPLLKRLMDEAPGTFHHSVQVARLAEVAAGVIGANSMLCRVGGLYHDIGKMDQPHFFGENQLGSNRLEELKPNISRIVIRNHVSAGVRIAREYGLHPEVIRFIETHHGTSLIRFFYNKAKLEKEEDEQAGPVLEKDYRYEGPRPSTREQGILMLADSCEAAVRSMAEINPESIRKMVSSIHAYYTTDGQFDQCPMSRQEFIQVIESFIKMFNGIYHKRVEYPSKPGEDRVKSRATSTAPPPDPAREDIGSERTAEPAASHGSRHTNSSDDASGD